MAEFDVDDEILELAVAREVDANKFYLAIAARVKNLETQKVLLELAAEELEHKAKLELEIIKTGRVVKTTGLANGLLDDSPDYSNLRVEIDYKDILLLGIRKEQASFKLYTDLARMTTDRGSKQMFLALADEEEAHKKRFQAEFQLAFPGD